MVHKEKTKPYSIYYIYYYYYILSQFLILSIFKCTSNNFCPFPLQFVTKVPIQISYHNVNISKRNQGYWLSVAYVRSHIQTYRFSNIFSVALIRHKIPPSYRRAEKLLIQIFFSRLIFHLLVKSHFYSFRHFCFFRNFFFLLNFKFRKFSTSVPNTNSCKTFIHIRCIVYNIV